MGWYLVDVERTNELGEELLHGPFATLKEARDEIRKRARSFSWPDRSRDRRKGSAHRHRRRPSRGSTGCRKRSRPTSAGWPWRSSGLASPTPRTGQEGPRRVSSDRQGPRRATAQPIDRRGGTAERNGRRELVRRVIGILADDGLTLGYSLCRAGNWSRPSRSGGASAAAALDLARQDRPSHRRARSAGAAGQPTRRATCGARTTPGSVLLRRVVSTSTPAPSPSIAGCSTSAISRLAMKRPARERACPNG